LRLKILVGVLAVLVVGALAVTALAGYRFFFSPKHDDAIALVPANSFAYASVFLEPSTQQKMAIEDLLAKTPLKDFDTAAERLKELFDDGLDESGCTFEEDFEPWIGDQIAGFGIPPDSAAVPAEGAALIAVTDENAARDSYYECNESEVEVEEEKSYNGVDYEIASNGDALAFVDGFAVLGSEEGVKASIGARDGNTLEDSDKFQKAFDDLEEDRLVTAYVDLAGVFDLAAEDAAAEDVETFKSLYGDAVDQPITLTLSARSDAIVLETGYGIPTSGSLGRLSFGEPAEILGELPSDSWGVFGIGDLGDYVQSILDVASASDVPGADQELLEKQIRKETGLDLQNDLLAWMGDVGIFVRGTSLFSLNGGLVIETTDPDAATGAMVVLGQYLAEQGIPIEGTEIGDARGFRVRIPGAPQPINAVVGNGRAVIAYGDSATEQALMAQDTLAQDEDFTKAVETIGVDYPLTAYVEMKPILDLVENAGGTDETYQEDAKPFLESVKYFAMGTKVSDDKGISRLVLGVE
jgi:hypothetical protein